VVPVVDLERAPGVAGVAHDVPAAALARGHGEQEAGREPVTALGAAARRRQPAGARPRELGLQLRGRFHTRVVPRRVGWF
jgi:hypothetical protein